MTKKLSDCKDDAERMRLRASAKRYREKNYERLRAQSASYSARKWREDADYRRRKNDRVNEFKRRQAYGFGLAEIMLMIEAQNGRCMICEADIRQKYHTDHCHKTGVVRGILCVGCNVFLGKYEKYEPIMSKVVAYLERHRDGGN